MKKWILYDSRWHTDPDRAIVYIVVDSLEEAHRWQRKSWPDAVIVETFVKTKRST